MALVSAVAPAVAEEYALLMMESAMEACMAQAVKSSGGFEDMFAAGFATDDAAFVGGGGPSRPRSDSCQFPSTAVLARACLRQFGALKHGGCDFDLQCKRKCARPPRV